MKSVTRTLRLLAAAALLAVFSGCEKRDPNLVQGYIEGEYVYVASPYAASLEKLAVHRGQQIEKDVELYALDSRPQKAVVEESERRLAQAHSTLEDLRKGRRPTEIESLTAQLEQAQAALARSVIEFDRIEKLQKKDAVSVDELDTIRSTRDQDRAHVAQLTADIKTSRLGSREDQISAAEETVKAQEAMLEKAKWDLSQMQQSSAQAGLVFDTLYRQGEWVAAGRPVVMLLPPANIKVRAFVPEERVGSIKIGDSIEVTIDGVADSHTAKVSYVSAKAEYTPPIIYSRETRSKLVFMIEATFEPEIAATLHPGQPVDVQLGAVQGGDSHANELAIDVKGMTKKFGSRTVVDHIDLQVKRGEIFGFLGPNGSGKTTFIRMLCGLLRADAGSGTCLGRDVIKESEYIKREVGYMTQKFSFYEDLSITENLDFVARMYAVPHRHQAVRESIDKLGLRGRETQLAGQLSGGWKQRLALAACMIHDPKLLLLDEPTAGVDPKARRDFWEQIHSLAARGLTVLITTHYMDEAERCHRLAYIFNGKMLANGTVSEVVNNAKLTTWAVAGDKLNELAEQLRGKDGVEQAVAFGTELHVSGPDAAKLEATIAPYRQSAYKWRQIAPSLEDVFIHLMESAQNASAKGAAA